jgi:hypothetical protein
MLSETMHSSSGGEIRLRAKDDDALRATIRARQERMSKFNPSDLNPGLFNSLPPRDILLPLSLSDHTSDDLEGPW